MHKILDKLICNKCGYFVYNERDAAPYEFNGKDIIMERECIVCKIYNLVKSGMSLKAIAKEMNQ